MNYQKIAQTFEVASKICAVATIVAIPTSVTPAVILFNLTILFSLAAGNYREKFNLIFNNPLASIFIAFFCMFLVGVFYSSAPMSDILIVLRKHSKFLAALIFLPIFIEEKWRNYAVFSFIFVIFVMLICSYLVPYGYFHWAQKGPVEVFKISMEFNFLMAFGAYVCLVQMLSVSSSRYRFLLFVLFILLTHTCLFRSIGRSGYFVYVGLFTLFFVQKYRWRGFIFSLLFLPLLLGFAYKFSSAFQSRGRDAFREGLTHLVVTQKEKSAEKTDVREDFTSVGLRMRFVENALRIIKSYPLIGTGTGSYSTEYKKLKPTPPDLAVMEPNPHNEYILITVQHGILGFIILMLFFVLSLWYSKFLPEKEKYIARGIIISVMIGSLANNWLTAMLLRYSYVYFMVLAFAALPKEQYLFRAKK